MKIYGRLLVRKNKNAGLYIPFNPDFLEEGIYEIRQNPWLEDLTIKYIGKPHMNITKYNALTIESLIQNPSSGMTKEEYSQVYQE